MLLKRTHTTEFDPAKKAHRDAVRAFSTRNAWGDSSLRFSHDPAYGSVADQVQAKLLKWYMAKESIRCKTVVKTPTPRTYAMMNEDMASEGQ